MAAPSGQAGPPAGQLRRPRLPGPTGRHAGRVASDSDDQDHHWHGIEPGAAWFTVALPVTRLAEWQLEVGHDRLLPVRRSAHRDDHHARIGLPRCSLHWSPAVIMMMSESSGPDSPARNLNWPS
jgi:hypothetical protein